MKYPAIIILKYFLIVQQDYQGYGLGKLQFLILSLIRKVPQLPVLKQVIALYKVHTRQRENRQLQVGFH
jgi:hypothetical protein